MLEPFLRPRAGQVFWGLAALAAALASFAPTGVTTRGDFVPASVLFPVVALFALVRFAGVSVAIWQRRESMGIGYRITSWLALAGVVFLLGFFESFGIAAFALVCTLDLAGGLAKRRPRAPAARAGPKRASRATLAIAVAAVVLGFVLFHFFVALRFEFGLLLDWSYVVLAVGIALRLTLAGPKPAGALPERPPVTHRIHARTERALPDPLAARLTSAFDTFLDEGDAGPLLDAAALLAELRGGSPAQVREGVLAALARPGTSRAEDLAAALEIMEAHTA